QPGAGRPDEFGPFGIFGIEMLARGNGLGDELLMILPADPGGVIREADIEVGLEDEMDMSGHERIVQPTVPRTTSLVVRVSWKPGASGVLRRRRISRTKARTRSCRSNFTVVRL